MSQSTLHASPEKNFNVKKPLAWLSRHSFPDHFLHNFVLIISVDPIPSTCKEINYIQLISANMVANVCSVS